MLPPSSPQPLPMDPQPDRPEAVEAPAPIPGLAALATLAPPSAEQQKASYDSPRASYTSVYRASFPTETDAERATPSGSPMARSVSTPEVRNNSKPRPSPRSLHRSTPFWEIKEKERLRQREESERQKQVEDASSEHAHAGGSSIAVTTQPPLIPEESEDIQSPVQRPPPSKCSPSIEVLQDKSVKTPARTPLNLNTAMVQEQPGLSADDMASGSAYAPVQGTPAHVCIPSRSPTSSGFLLPTTPMLLGDDRAAHAREATSPPAFTSRAHHNQETEPDAALEITPPEGAPMTTSKQRSAPVLSRAPQHLPTVVRATSLFEKSEVLHDVDVHKLICQFESISASASPDRAEDAFKRRDVPGHNDERNASWMGGWVFTAMRCVASPSEESN
uniref:Uncharacterized protein n=1 Tax=Strombidinopsis acuminata TaxID=141414 RepID=A0A7S3TJ31_9SPIT